MINDWVTEFPRVLEGFKEEDIYNTGETGLFLKACANKTVVLPDDDGQGGKFSKDRVTLLLTCSWMGEKMKLILIGKSKKPRALKGTNMARLSVDYRYQNKAWRVGSLFEEVLLWFDKEVSKNNKERRVLLFMDNASECPQECGPRP